MHAMITQHAQTCRIIKVLLVRWVWYASDCCETLCVRFVLDKNKNPIAYKVEDNLIYQLIAYSMCSASQLKSYASVRSLIKLCFKVL